MALYDINDQIKNEIIILCDSALKSQGIQAHNIKLT